MSNSNLSESQFRTLYHSTGYSRPTEIEASGFTPSPMGESGPGVYLSGDRSYAELLSSGKPNQVTFEVEADIRNPLVRYPEDPEDPGEREYRSIQQNTDGFYTKEGAALDALRSRGYDAVESFLASGHEVAVHDPSRLRITRRLQPGE